MIFVTLGTQDKSFVRLLEEIQNQITSGNIQEKVIVQAGITDYSSDDMEIYSFMSQSDFQKYMKKCDLLITHGGVGSILTGLRYGKKVIAVPRLKKYDEHESDHQIQIIEEFSKKGYILGVKSCNQLGKALDKVSKFYPKEHQPNQEMFIQKLEHYIENGTL